MTEKTELMAPNGSAIVGTLEVIPGTAHILGVHRNASGEVAFDWEGGTKVFWDTSRASP